jgi:ATP phosphoribosyltransferase
LKANGLKVLDDGIILRSEANLIASLKAPWGPRARATIRTVLARIAAEEEARTTREVRAGMDPGRGEIEAVSKSFGAVLPLGRDSGRELVLHCPADRVFDLVESLIGLGAQDVTVRTLDYVFRETNPLAERLFGRLGPDLSTG